MGRISGPILDRIELIVNVDPPREGDLFKKSSKSSQVLKSEMEQARNYLKQNPEYFSLTQLQERLDGTPWLQAIFKSAYSKGFLSLRRIGAVLKTALSLALLENKELAEDHVFGALQFTRIRWQEDGKHW
jgi:magnesium chelatase family protein